MKYEVNWSAIEAGSFLINASSLHDAEKKLYEMFLDYGDVAGDGELEFNIDEIEEITPNYLKLRIK